RRHDESAQVDLFRVSQLCAGICARGQILRGALAAASSSLSTASCCRRARFSTTSPVRDRKPARTCRPLTVSGSNAGFVTLARPCGILSLVPAPPEPRSRATTPTSARSTGALSEPERELQTAVDEIARGECVVLSAEDVARWAETGVPPWQD